MRHGWSTLPMTQADVTLACYITYLARRARVSTWPRIRICAHASNNCEALPVFAQVPRALRCAGADRSAGMSAANGNGHAAAGRDSAPRNCRSRRCRDWRRPLRRRGRRRWRSAASAFDRDAGAAAVHAAPPGRAAARRRRSSSRSRARSARPVPQHRAGCRTASRRRRCRVSPARPASTGRPLERSHRRTRASASCTAATSPAPAPPTLLPEIVREALAALPIPKPMRWGDHDYRLRAAGALAGAAARRRRGRGRAARRARRPHEPRPPFPRTTSRCGSARAGDYVDALRARLRAGRPDRAAARTVRSEVDSRRRARPAAARASIAGIWSKR